ncbi:YodC family protein [Ectopseudomonas composti]|uniref:YodC family protein n=1 Tax=Ectopseudomonas composti TaxID=658457 RepID=UPI00094478F6|nr:YodC family protein [Pseudomonas composti]
MAGNNVFKIGDIVRLKSGGPDMTIQVIPKPGYSSQYKCQWFAGKKLEDGIFPPDSLELVKQG